ncbi:MAG: hypothetical protein CVU61_05075 [Deltaproteobacteria bacterium HGW-Deltaproteobacteria-19]|nr:MAG: hypothetical protein CVU61_05075 [Deltaproteobacteria bacterium HGW-Deltaproteobacteria-19]
MIMSRKSGFVWATIGVVFFLAVLTGCFDSSPKLYCSGDPDSKQYNDTGLTLNKVMKALEKKKFTYNYDEKNKVLEFKSKEAKYPIKIYFKDHASGLAAYKAGQEQEAMQIGRLQLAPAGELVFDSCKLLNMIVKEPKK